MTEIGVYTQGKVGSKSLVATLSKAFSDRHIWDFRRTFDRVADHLAIRGTRPRLLSEDVEFTQFVREQPVVDLMLIATVREPVAIAVSSFFYNFGPRNPDMDIVSLTDEEIRQRLVAGESFNQPSFHLDWFDIEVRPFLGLDVYEHAPFPRDTGYAIYAAILGGRSSRLLVIRLEDLDRVAAQALAEFFGIQIEYESDRQNVGCAQAYGSRYAAFLASAKLRRSWVEWQLNSKYARFFYSLNERKAAALRWTGAHDSELVG